MTLIELEVFYFQTDLNLLLKMLIINKCVYFVSSDPMWGTCSSWRKTQIIPPCLDRFIAEKQNALIKDWWTILQGSKLFFCKNKAELHS